MVGYIYFSSVVRLTVVAMPATCISCRLVKVISEKFTSSAVIIIIIIVECVLPIEIIIMKGSPLYYRNCARDLEESQ